MASISAPTHHNLSFLAPSSTLRRPSSSHSFASPTRFSDYSAGICRCQSSSPSSPSPSDSSSRWRWEAAISDAIKTALTRFDSCFKDRSGDLSARADSPSKPRDDDPEWDWDRWKQYFAEVDEGERLVSVLKTQLSNAIKLEDFEDAARLKVAIAATASNDVVGRAMYQLNRAVEEEKYQDAAFIRDNAGAGLVGWWWSGIAKDINISYPHGVIIRITAEHGRYVARSYSPRQLSTGAAGVPLFEIFFTVNKKGEYRQQAVYLKRGSTFQDISVSPKASDSRRNLDPLDSTDNKADLLVAVYEDADDEDESDKDDVLDAAQGFSGFQNIFKDVIPGVKFRVLKVTSQDKVDKDLISKVVEEIIEEDDGEKDDEIEGVEVRDEEESKGDLESAVIESDARPEISEREIAVKVLVGGLVHKMTSEIPTRDVSRVPAKLVKNGGSSFSFSIENDVEHQDSHDNEQASTDKKMRRKGLRDIDRAMFDVTKFIGEGKMSLKVLKNVGDLMSITLRHTQNHLPLSGSTTFNRIELPTSSDPLNGLYIGAHGIFTSEVIHLKRKFGQWKDDSGTTESSNVEFYEYVEALNITGDPYVPAGQVAFRAKVGKRYQLPHKGIIPEEFGVIARYKGQGRLAGPGFRNTRWVDGELVILDAKYMKNGPVVGFVYWAPEHQFLAFFNRLKLQE